MLTRLLLKSTCTVCTLYAAFPWRLLYDTCGNTGSIWGQQSQARLHVNKARPADAYDVWDFPPSHAPWEVPDISLLDPALQKQWDHAANAHLGTIEIQPDSNLRVEWICDQCPGTGHWHTWSALVSSRTSGSGCPARGGRKVCSHNSLATMAPRVAAQWDYEVNDGSPDNILMASDKLVGWRCGVCKHRYMSTPKAQCMRMPFPCPMCATMK